MLEKQYNLSNPARFLASESHTLPDLFLRRLAISGDRVAFQSKVNGQWVATTWRQFYEQSAAIASYLIARGLQPGEKITMLGRTCAEWCLCDIGGQLAGLVTVGAYPTLAVGQLAYILDHSD